MTATGILAGPQRPMELTTFDWIIIVGYFAVTLGIGLAFSRRAGSSLSEYFVSGRSLPWWIAGTSMVATTFAADTPLAVTGLVASNGLAGNWVWWAMAAGGMCTVFVYARLWRRAEVITDVELTELRYGGKPAAVLRCVRAIYVALIINPIIIGWVTSAMVTVLKEGLFSEPGSIGGGPTSDAQNLAIICGCLAVVGVYCTFSGMWGVAITDVVQFVMAMTGCVLLAVVAVNHVGGIEQLQTKVAANFGDGEQAFRFLPAFDVEEPWMPLHVFLIFLLVQWWATWYPGAEPGGGGYVVQRMAACKDERHTVLATLWYQIAHYCLRPWPWLMVAFVALAMYPEVRQLTQDANMAEELGTNADAGFAWVMRDLSPPGLRGLMLVTFFAAFMSTISTQMNWGASYLVRDVYQRFIAPNATDQQLARTSRFVSLIVLAAGAIASWVMLGVNIGEIWKVLLALGAGTGAVYMLRWFWWRINAWSEIVAMVASLIYFVSFRNRLTWDGVPLRDEELILVVAGATIATWLIATFVTPPESTDKLVRFYRLVRPGGSGWKPIAAQAPDVQVDQNLGLSILAAIAGSGIVYCTLPGVGLLIFGDYAKGAGCLVGAAVFAVCVGVLMKKIGWKNVV